MSNLRHALTQSLTTVLALGGLESSWTFMRKNVILVRRSTVDLRSISFSLLDAGKLLRYIDKSIRNELCNWSRSLTNFSFYIDKKRKVYFVSLLNRKIEAV